MKDERSRRLKKGLHRESNQRRWKRWTLARETELAAIMREIPGRPRRAAFN